MGRHEDADDRMLVGREGRTVHRNERERCGKRRFCLCFPVMQKGIMTSLAASEAPWLLAATVGPR
jgi:hypothetical protein